MVKHSIFHFHIRLIINMRSSVVTLDILNHNLTSLMLMIILHFLSFFAWCVNQPNHSLDQPKYFHKNFLSINQNIFTKIFPINQNIFTKIFSRSTKIFSQKFSRSTKMFSRIFFFRSFLFVPTWLILNINHEKNVWRCLNLCPSF